MKKFVIMVLVAVLAFVAYQKKAERKRELLVGKWSSQRAINGGWIRLIMNLKPEGEAIVSVDGELHGRPGYYQSLGTWKLHSNALLINFNRSDVPVYRAGKDYGGSILTLDDQTLSYKSEDGTESWKKIP